MDYESVYNPQFLVDVDAVMGYINNLIDALQVAKDEIDNLLDEVKEKYEKGKIPQTTYDEIIQDGEKLKGEVEDLKTKTEELSDLKEKINNAASEEEKANFQQQYSELENTIDYVTETVNKHIEDFNEKCGAIGIGNLTKPTNSFFDGMIKYGGSLSTVNNDVEFMYRKLQPENSTSGKDINAWYKDNINNQSVGFYWTNNLDSLYAKYENMQDEFSMFFYFNEKENTLSYKIKYSDTFFADSYGINLPIDREQYAAAFNKLVIYYPGQNDPTEYFVKTAWGLNEMLSNMEPVWQANEDSDTGSLTELLMGVIDFLHSCQNHNFNEGLVPKCFWENSTVTAYPSGMIDGAWDILTTLDNLANVINSIDPTAGYYYTEEGKATRQAVFSTTSSLINLVQSKEKLKKFKNEIVASGLEYVDETVAFNPQAAYNQGKLIFDVASLFIGIGEIKQIKNGANIFKVVAASAKNMGQGIVGLSKHIGGLVQKGYVKAVNTGQVIILKTMLEVEIARFSDEGILHVSKWIDEPVEIIAKIGDDPIRYTTNMTSAVDELFLVKAADGSEGIGKWSNVAKGGSLLDDIFNLQKAVITKNKNIIANASNNAKGAFGEIASDAFLTEKGFKPLHPRKTALTDGWGETGIDGVFVKDGQYYIVEAKYHGQATLTPANKATGLPKQMTDDWIKGSNRLRNAVDATTFDAMDATGYRRLLAEVAPDGSVVYKELDSNAIVIGMFNP
jgi:hypothetical protein